MAEEIKTGSVVQLKSGGPEMTVHSTEGRDAYCEWFLNDGKHEGASFPVTSLIKVRD